MSGLSDTLNLSPGQRSSHYHIGENTVDTEPTLTLPRLKHGGFLVHCPGAH